MRKLICLLLVSLIIKHSVLACSAFAICKGDRIIVGKNLDWFCNMAYLVVNKRNVSKKAFLSSNASVLEWTSKYGSITFTQNGVGLTSGGMNEAGLVIEESWLGPTQYPVADERPVIDEIQWIQYQLDNCSKVEEVIATNSKLRIQKYYGKSHYFVYDKSGNTATIDFVNGEMVYHLLHKTDVQVLTNDTYQLASDSLKNFEGFGGTRNVPNGTKSIYRFGRAAKMIKDYERNDSTNIIDYGFGILSNIAQKSTAWSVVYDISNLRIYYKTSSSPEIKEVSFNKFDLDCSSPMMLIEINLQKKGDISNLFEPYTLEKNRDLVTKVIKNWRENKFALHITDAEVEKLIQYPETMRCNK
ncbi:MAG TPA: linear amide C-N hydrolase [Bacteroidales bacterium]